MYLKRLEIQGFKSFADKVEFEFSGGITAIVGPNGSGKSNVVDSIRWVLGEQSAKNLRGGKMDDVIFAGSRDRRPVGMAQVVLTLDNSAGLFPLDYDEVTIARRLYRSGESEYLINKTPCRLKDIHELFMDTGLGREGFSVISQGKVDEILSLKAEDRRGLIEEAAGIIKYKYRKKEAMKKLEDTEENMVRINDIISELQARVEPLGQQAEKAKSYQLFKHELDALEITLEVEDLEKNTALEEELKNARQVTEDKVAVEAAKQSTLDAHLARGKMTLQQGEEALGALQESYYELQTEMEKKSNEITLGGQMRDNFLEQEEKLEGERAFYQGEGEKLAEETQLKTKQAQQLVLSLQTAEDGMTLLSQKLTSRQQEKEKSEKDFEALKEQSIVNMQAQAKNHNELLRLSQALDNNEKRKARLDEKKERLGQAQADLGGQREAISSQKQALMAQLEEKESQIQGFGQAVAVGEAKIIEAQKKLDDQQMSYQQIKSKYQALQDLEQSGDGYQFGVKSVLEQKKQDRLSGVVGTVAQLIKVPDYLEKAIETVLGGGLQNIVMSDDKAAQTAITYLKANQKGRATFLPLNTIKGYKATEQLKNDHVLGLAVDLIAFDPQYQQVMNYLLGRVWIVDDLAQAVSLGKSKGFSQRLVTLDGDLITPGGALTGGNYAKQKSSLLGRGRQIEELQHLGTQLALEIKSKMAELAGLQEATVLDRAHLERHKEERQGLKLQLKEVEQQEEQASREAQRLSKDLAFEMLDIADITQEMDELQQSLRVEENQTQLIAQEKSAITEQLGEKKAHIDEIATQIAQEMGAFQQSQIDLATLRERHGQLGEQLEAQEARLAQALLQEGEKKAQRDRLIKRREEKEREVAQNKIEVEQLAHQLQEKGHLLAKQKEDKLVLQGDLAQREDELKVLQKQLDEHKNRQYAINLELSKVKTQVEQGLRRLALNFDCTFGEALLKKVLITDYKVAQKQVSKLKHQIQALGSINFTAIEEYAEVTKRLTFLTAQVDDLLQAKQSLDKVIKEMEQIMAQKFKETYLVVNETFSSVFQAMFGGGDARLELSYPQDFLLTGIEIVAQPPGKKEQILSLLSGGERAMTAIALLFALLTVKPSPFCILDEIEAALDDVNVDRFAGFIRDYTHKTQFIVISHRKGTMEAADVLYGVAMENNGVSKLMSVRLSDYD